MDDKLILVQASAIRASCAQLSAPQLLALQQSVARACQLPRAEWDLKAAAHAEVFSLLAGTADDPVLVHALSSGAVLAQHLMVTVGRAVNGMTVSSRQRFLVCLGAGDPEGAAREMEGHLRVLSFMGRVVAGQLRPS
ncbi:MAG: FCD domain-containing protein [Streptosporangiaceae bacterium]